MNLLETYIFRTARSAFLAGLGVLTAVIWLTQALKEFDLLTTKGQSLITFLEVTALGIPSLVLVIAPAALFIAVLYSLNKLNSDSELIVMSAAGLSPARLMRPFLKLTVLTALMVGAISLYVMPWSFRELRVLIMKIRADFLSHVVREGTFTTLDEGFVFHYRQRDTDGSLLGILMEDRRDPAHISSYVAERGLTVEVEDNNYLALTNGNVQRQQPQANGHDTAIIVFKRYALDLAQFGAEGQGAPLKPRERTTRDLFALDLSEDEKKQAGKFRAELHDRFIAPLFALSFGMVAFVALGEARTTRQGRGTAILSAVVAVLLLRVTGFFASILVSKGAPASVVFDYAVPMIGLVVGTFLVFGRRLPSPRIKPLARFVARPA